MSLGGFVDDFSGSLTGTNSGTVAKSLLGETDEMAIIRFPTPVPGEVRIFLNETKIKIVVGVFTGVFISEEILDISDTHAGVIGHHGVANDVTRLESVKRGGRRRWGGRKRYKSESCAKNE